VKFAILLLALLLSFKLSAASCSGWFDHLGPLHNVWIIKDSPRSIRNSGFDYKKIPNSNLVLALPKDELQWKSEISKDGKKLKVSNMFNYSASIEFKNNQCIDSFGYADDTKKEFLYDWRLCEFLVPKFEGKLKKVDALQNYPAPKDLEVRMKYSDLMDKKIDDAYLEIYNLLSFTEKEAVQKNIKDYYLQNKIESLKDKNLVIQTIKSCRSANVVIQQQDKINDSFKSPAKISK
jgi:hypothetical protein